MGGQINSSILSMSNNLGSIGVGKQQVLGLTSVELCEYLRELGEKPYHGKQIYRALHAKRQFTFEEMTELSKSLRKKLMGTAQIFLPKTHSTQLSNDGTQKYLFELRDGLKIESVFIPEENRNTLCISTQVGCPMDCQFCLTALLGFVRNLTVDEIVAQVLLLLKDQQDPNNHSSPLSPSKPTNIVLMGMGEPLLNFDNVSKALVIMADSGGLGISPHRITLSTVGLVPKILELAKAPVVPNLAISLSATTDDVRNKLMPINRKYPISVLLDACAAFPLAPRQRMTFEYVLIDGINDRDDDARRLVKILSRLRSKVNLLPLNTGKNNLMKPSTPERVKRFRQILISKALPTYIRRPRGADIFAACGQLHRAQG
jgi:23S rRNA (adenine2503-C2)-methyltransferase